MSTRDQLRTSRARRPVFGDGEARHFGAELRAEVTGDKLRGVAVVWDAVAEIMPGEFEQVTRAAFEPVMGDDARALFNHNRDLILGRMSAGTLRAGLTDDGLEFEIDLPNTTYARDLRESVERRDVNGVSFGAIPGDIDRTETPDGRPLVRHTRFARWLDVSPVTYPAYTDGPTVALRAQVWGRRPRRNPRERLIRTRHALNMEGQTA